MVKVKREKIILSPKKFRPSSKKFKILGVLNPGALRLKDGKIVLYVRVMEQLIKKEDLYYYYSPRFVGKTNFKIKIDKFRKSTVDHADDLSVNFGDGVKRLNYISYLKRVIIDKKGFKILKIDKKPSFFGLDDESELGVEDPRITQIRDKYYMTYVGLSRRHGISTYLAVSKDGFNWDRKGIIFGEQDKDVVLFPERIKGKYVAFDRPEGNFEFSLPHIWVAYSRDLIHWGELRELNLKNRSIKLSRSGSGPPPIKIDKGWLFMYHGVTKFKGKKVIEHIKKTFNIDVKSSKLESYSVWAALLSLDNPEKIVARTKYPIIMPKKSYKSFEDKMVIFPTGLIQDKNNLLVYSGVGDIYIMVSKIGIKDILKVF